MHEEVLKGKSKYRVAREMDLNEMLVYNHTRDISEVKPGEPCIRGKSFDLLKQILDLGYVRSNNDTNNILRRMRRNLPMILRTQVDGKSIYYLNDKNKFALQAMIAVNKSRIITYRELNSISKVFGVNLSSDEKRKTVRLPQRPVMPIIRKKNGGFLFSLKKNQARLDDFNGKNSFIGRNGLRNQRKIQGSKFDSLRENEDSLVDFCTRMYWK